MKTKAMDARKLNHAMLTELRKRGVASVQGGGPRCLDSLMGGISSDSVGFFLVKHQAASANG
jgi:hypothetical protein